MKGSKRKKIIAIALVATLACSGSVTSAFAATNEGTGITNHTNALPFADEATVAENEPAEEVESETQTELNEQKEHTEDEIAVKEETIMPPKNASAANNTVAAAPRAGEVAIDETNFPDANFREFVKQYDTDGNGSFSDEELAKVTTIYCSSKKLTSLQGIEYFTALRELKAEYNQLTYLDVSKNIALEKLELRDNRLTSLDVSKNVALKDLGLYSNELTHLDVSNNTALINLVCNYNELTSLDVSNNTALETLYCNSNNITHLDVSNNTALKEFYCGLNALTSLDISKNTAIIKDDFSSRQSVQLGTIPKDYDLLQRDPNIRGDKITNPEGATFNGTVMSVDNPYSVRVEYDYDIGNGKTIHVVLRLNVLIVNSNITYKDGNTNFVSWKAGYTAPSTYKEGIGVSLPTADNIEKEGYTFVGWYDNENFTGNPITEIDAAATGDQTLYAKFEVNQYTVTFKDWDGTELKTEQVAYNTGATAPTDPTRDGYRFTGWDKTFDTITENTEITAQYVKTWNVTFQDEDGTVLKTETVDEGTGATAPTEPTKEGHTFAGWDVAFDNITGDTVVTATYEVNQYTVTFKDWDGTELKTEQVAYNTGATAPTDPTRDGYRFTGWDVAFDNITGDTVVTAQYEKEEAVVPPTEPEQPQTPEQGGEMNNTETEEKTQTSNNLEAAKTGDNSIVEPLLATGGISSVAAAIAFFFRKKKKSEQ